MLKTKIKETKKRKNNSDWFELIEKKEEFKKIVHLLNRYYDLHSLTNHPSSAHLFRLDIVVSELDKLRIFLKKFGTFEFLVAVEISSEAGKKLDSWIHIDGISQERILMREKGKLEHPVFRITSLDDLFQSYTKEVEKGFELKPEDSLLL